MKRQTTKFYSAGYGLDAAFYWPDQEDSADGNPLFVICSGFTGLKHIQPERFARLLTGLGYPCFSFDYRGFGKSEGGRSDVTIENQVSDIVNALSYVSTHWTSSGRRLVLMGWGMGGGLVLEASRLFSRIDALVSVNGFYDAVRVQKALRGEGNWQAFQNWLMSKRALAVSSGMLPDIDAFDVYPLDPVTEQYVNVYLRAAEDYNEGTTVSLGFVNSLLRFCPEKHLEHLSTTPLFIAHGDTNALHPVEEATSLYEHYPGPESLYWLAHAGHTEWMHDDNPSLHDLVSEIDRWTRQQLHLVDHGPRTVGTSMSMPPQASSSGGVQPAI